ncbi:hypothetical protein Tco_1270773 [Tanacetum coccineum]
MALWTSSLALVLAYGALPFHSNKDCFNLTKEDLDFEAQVPGYPLMKFKDIVKIITNPQGMGDFVTNMLNHMKASKGIIWNTFKELEESSLETISQDYPIPSFTLGPFHKHFTLDGFERVGIESAIKRIMTDKEGEETRERICYLKEKVNHSLDEGGSSHE